MKSFKLGLITITLLFTSNIFSQTDDKRFCFEPIVGTFIPKYKFSTNENISIINKEHYGFKFGFLKNVGIGQVFVVRPAVTLTGLKRETYITDLTDNSEPVLFNNSIEAHMQASMHFSQNFSSGRARTFLYLIQGVTLDLNMANQEYDQDLWLEDNQNLTIDLGIGTRFYANRKHLFAAEIIYSFGVRNIKDIGINVNSTKINPAQARNYTNMVNNIGLHYITLQLLL